MKNILKMQLYSKSRFARANHMIRVISGMLACIFSVALYAATTAPIATPIPTPIPTPIAAPAVSAASSDEKTTRLSAAEPLACLVFETGMPRQLALQEEQLVAWRHLERQHALLFGNRCANAGSEHPAPVLAVQFAEDAVSLHAYEKNLHDFISGLSEAQRARLGEIARLYHESRAALEERIIRHRLML